MKIYDADGQERDWEWVVSKYNLPAITEAPKDKDHWEVVALHENCRDSSMTVRALQIDGSPALYIPVFFSWPEGRARGFTNRTGEAGFGMGFGAYYKPPDIGPHWADVGKDIGSDVVTGLGMLGRRDHWHLEPTFQFVSAEEPEEDDYRAKYEELLGVLGDIESIILPYVMDEEAQMIAEYADYASVLETHERMREEGKL